MSEQSDRELISVLHKQREECKDEIARLKYDAKISREVDKRACEEIARLKALMLEALDFLDSGETYREQYYDEMFELVDKLREAAK